MKETRAFTTGSADETRSLGETLGGMLEAGDVVLLSGELGAGKTVFVKGMAAGVGYDGPVSSKSFVLLGEYDGRVKLYHADLYRLDEPEMVEDLALDELVEEGVVAVEWPERADAYLPEDGLLIRFEIEGEERRTLALAPVGERAESLAARFEKAVRG